MEQEQILYKLELDDNQLQAELDKTTAALIKSDKAVKQLNGSLKATETEIAALDKELQANGKLTADQEKRLQSLKQTQVQQTQALVQQRAESSRLRGEQSNYIKQLSNLEGSNNRLRGQLSVLTAQYNALSREQRLNTKEGVAMQKQIKAISDELKANESAVGDNRRNVGNYTAAIKESIPGLGGAIQGVQGFNTALKANPLLAIIGLLVPFIQSIGKAQFAVDAFKSVFEPLNAIFQRAIGIGQELASLVGGKITKAFQDPKQAIQDLGEFILNNVINRFKAFGVIIEAVANRDLKGIANGLLQLGSGVENVIDKVGEAGAAVAKEISDAAKQGQRLAQLRILIEKRQNQFALNEQKIRREFELQRSIVQDVNKSSEERRRAAERAVSAIAKERDERLKILDLEIEEAQIRASLNDTDRKAQGELNKLLAQRDGLQADFLAKTNEVRNQINALNKAQADSNAAILKKQAEDADKLKQQQADAFAKLSEAELTASLKVIDRTFKEQQDALRELQAQGLITEQQFADESVALQATKLQRQIQEIQEYADTVQGTEELIAQKQLELSDLVTEARIADFKRLYDEQKKQADEALKQEQARQQAFQQAVTSQLQGISQASQQLANDLVQNNQAVLTTFAKNALTTTLDVIERQLIAQQIASIFDATSKGIAQGPLGLIAAGFKIAGISAAFGVAKAGIQQALSFHTGGVVPQSSNGRLNRGGDDTLALVKSGEVIANSAQQSRIEAIAGPDIWARAGIPGFNAGGFVPPAPADIPNPQIDLSSANLVVSVRDIDSQLATVRVTQNRRTL